MRTTVHKTVIEKIVIELDRDECGDLLWVLTHSDSHCNMQKETFIDKLVETINLAYDES